MLHIAVVVSLALASFTAAAGAPLVPAGIQWRTWDAAAFREAVTLNRPIIVNVGHEGCTACRTMEENTFSDANVIALMNTHFVPIQVDSEARPDIGERYSDWAWPATAFLKPDGSQVFALRGSRRADDFAALLERVIERHRAGELKVDERAPYGVPASPHEGPLSGILAQVRAQLDDSFDSERGGWGSAKILETAAPTLELFQRGYLHDDEITAWRAKITAEGFLQQLDPVWGGMFYASFGRWDNVVHEKRIESQAAALRLFADALQVTGDLRYAAGIERLYRYLTQWMTAPDGGFYASQKDAGPVLPDGMTMNDYYALDDAGRRRHGLPLTDRAVYTDLNGRVIGLVRAFEVTGRRAYLEAGLRAADAIVARRVTEPGWVVQFTAGDDVGVAERVHVLEETRLPYLRAQAHFGLAVLALFQATADERWRGLARRIADGMDGALADSVSGGWFAAPASELDAIVGRRKPLEDNAVAARFVYWLGVLDKQPALRAAAERAVRAVAVPEIVEREGRVTGNLALTLELLGAGYVEFSVVGDGDDPGTQALLQAARAVYEPRKLVHIEPPGRYPRRPSPALYICNDHQCTLPITEPAEVAPQAALFTPASIERLAGAGID